MEIFSKASELMSALGSADRKFIEHSTRQQSASENWYKERCCRLTASKFGVVVRRKRQFSSLVEELLYKKPPASLPSLQFGCKNEARAVELYQELHPEISVNESGPVCSP